MTTETPDLLPHSLEGERAILSCVLLDGPAALAKALDGKITEECFYLSLHGKVWRTILWLHKNNKPLELAVLAEELKKNGKMEELGGYAALVSCTTAAPTTAQLSYWVEKVRHHFVMRQLYGHAKRMQERVLLQGGSVEDFIKDTNDLLSLHHAGDTQETVAQACDHADRLCEKAMRGTLSMEETGMAFPWTSWSTRFGYAKPGELIIVAARPGMGKSSVARQIADKWAGNGTVLLFSREMTCQSIAPLMAQTACRISWRDIMRGTAHPADIHAFREELKSLRAIDRTLKIYDRDRTLSHIVARSRAAAQINGVAAIIVDYLQRYDPQQERGENRDIALGRFTMAMKDLATDLKIPVILLAQLGRGVEKEGREPRLSDLRESGNLEQDADRVIFLHAPEFWPDQTPQDPLDGESPRLFVNAIQAKGRSDGTGICGMTFSRNITRFDCYTPSK